MLIFESVMYLFYTLFAYNDSVQALTEGGSYFVWSTCFVVPPVRLLSRVHKFSYTSSGNMGATGSSACNDNI